MSLERNETARRFMEALLHAGEPQEIAKTVEIAVGCTDTLIAALVPVAPASGAPATEPRPEWVRITGPEDAERVTVGKAYRVQAYRPNGLPDWITNDRGEKWFLSDPGDHAHRTWPMWEPCAAPGETAGPAAAMPGVSPAATPAAWVPKVGDVVTIDCPDNALVYHEWWHGAVGVVEKAPEWLKASKYQIRVKYAPNYKGRRVEGWDDVPLNESHVRPATSSERAAAGLPVDEAKESAVDRVALAKAIYAAVAASNPTLYGKPWDEAKDVTKRDAFNAADAAIAFMAKDPAFDRAEFNEAQEREAAKVAVSRDAGDDFTRGWLARARVAAEGGPDAR